MSAVTGYEFYLAAVTVALVGGDLARRLAGAMVDRRAEHVRASEARRFARMVWESMGVRS